MDETASQGRALGIVRAAIGLIQGATLSGIYLAYDHKVWPATNWLIFAPLVLVFFFFVPPMVAQGLGTMRLRTLAIWGGLATTIIAALGYHNVWHAWPDEFGFGVSGARQPDFLVSPQLSLALVAGLFIAHSLITAANTDHRFPASYPTLFDAATKLAVQAVLAVLFTGVFWLLLRLGASLFSLIRIVAVERLLGSFWFSIPVTTLALAIAIHVSDVRAGIVRGIRTLGLVLLSWLLPL